MPFKKINDDEFEEESKPKIRRVKLSDLRTELKKDQMMLSNMNKKIKYFKNILAQSKYPEDARRFLNILKDEREMCAGDTSEAEALINKLEKM